MKQIKQIKQIIWSRKVMGSIVVCGALVSAGVFGLNGYFGGGEKGVPEDTMTRGLVAAYNFDEGSGQTLYNAADTGSANDGTLGSSAGSDSADPTWTTPDLKEAPRSGVGPSGTALDFDGTDDYVNCGNDSSLNITDAITIEAWVKTSDISQNSYFIQKDDVSSLRSWALKFQDSKIRFLIWDSSSLSHSLYSDAGVVNNNTWYHIIGIYNGSIQRLYVDGVLQADTKSWSDTIKSTPNEEVKMGGFTNFFFNGSIDEVRIYNRALSAEEVRYHYNRGGPVAHWKLDEGEGSTTYDETSNNNDGTLHLGSLGNTATSTAWTTGRYGTAIEFDGTDDYVEVPDDSSLDITGSITLAAWINDPPPEPNPLPNNDQPSVINNQSLSTEGLTQLEELREKLKITEIKSDQFVFKSLSGDLIEIGEERHSPPQPYLKINKWDNEVFLKVDVPYGKDGKKQLIGNKLRWTNDDYHVDFYPKEPEEVTEEINGREYTFTINEEGGAEFDVILKEKPETNIFKFPIESKGLKFYYQPPLNQENNPKADYCTETYCYKDEQIITHRPENVVGSYAVYHESKQGDYSQLGGKNYKAGKAFHIYRPKIIDTEGNEIWGELNLDVSPDNEKILTIIIDHDWLNNAIYPVRVDPQFGYEGVSGTSASSAAQDIIGSLFTSPADAGSATSISWYASELSSTTVEFKGVIVLHSSLNIISNGIGNATDLTVGFPSFGWHTSTFSTPPALSGNTEYVLAWITGLLDDSCMTKYDSGSANQEHIDTSNNYASPSNPTDATDDGNKKYFIYCTYTQSNTAPDIPTISSPSDGATGQSLTPDLVFNYSDTDSDDCTKFDLKVDNNSGFTSPEINETDYSTGGPWASGGTITYSVSSGLSAGTKYYWKVRVYDGTDWSNWSDGSWDFTTLNHNKIISKGNDAYSLLIDNNLNVLAYINNQSITTLITKKWHYVVLTYDGSTQKLYVDGILKASASLSGAITANATNITIGEGVPGKIDDIKIFDYARSPGEIRLDYNAGFAARFGPAAKTCSEDPASCMDQGLVGSWGFDEGDGQTAYNSADTGSANNGTLGSSSGSDTADPSWTTSGEGGRASSSGRSPPSFGALQFDGTDDYINCGNDPSLNITDAITIEAWVKPSGGFSSAENNQHILSKKNVYRLAFWGSTGKALLYLNSGAGAVFTTKTSWNEQWYHLVGTYDKNAGSDQLKIYIDGSLDNIATYSTAISINADDLRIGIRETTEHFNGTIDEVRIYNRALSAEEIRYHYNRGGPVAHWRFDEGEGSTMYDETSNNNDGTLHLGSLGNTATSSAWVTGKHGTAMDFDGTDDYVDCGNDSSLNITDAITIEAWVKSNTWADWDTIVKKADRSQSPEEVQYWFLVESSGYLGFWGKDASGTWKTFTDDQNTLNTGTWYHVAAVYNADNVFLYINGSLSDSGSLGLNPLISSNGLLSIGRGFVSGATPSNYEFDGTIDDVRIYNYARSPGEIRLDYNAGFAARFGHAAKTCSEDPASCMDNGLVGYWDMDEGDGQTAYNSADTGSANNGTLGSSAGADTNDPTWTSEGRSPTSSSGRLASYGAGGYLDFDGTNDYVGIPVFNPNDNDFSLTCWFKTEESTFRIMMAGTDITRDERFYIGINNFVGDGAYLTFEVDDGTNPLTNLASSSLVNDGIWHFATLVRDASENNFSLYLDGQFVDSDTNTDSSIDADYDTRIGDYSPDNHYYFNGAIDEVRIYNRALSAEEIRYHYNRGGPVAHWRFDEGEGSTTYDETSNNNDGALHLGSSGNTATSSAWVTGKHGTAMDFDGTDDYVNCGNDSSLNITDAITIEAWVKVNTNSGYQYLVMKNDCYLFCLYNNKHLNFYGYVALPFQEANTDVPVNEWFHAAVTYDKDVGTKFYLNGQLDGTGSDTGSLVIKATDLKIGSTYTPNGAIDEVRIYNYARTPAQIQMDYNAGFSTHLK